MNGVNPDAARCGGFMLTIQYANLALFVSDLSQDRVRRRQTCFCCNGNIEDLDPV
jgi:hypothetical protein